tara:strand:- start:2957 stop:3571 length:615 start_codon:yes stop_codon:yes gene_type:complete
MLIQIVKKVETMARPSMAVQRKKQILDAFEHCILTLGLQATSLENIAEQANMKRTILRHYIGNKDDIICALSERWKLIYEQQWQSLISWLPNTNRTSALIDMLFTVGSEEHVNNTIIGEAIFGEAKRLAVLKEHQEQIMNTFIEQVSTIISEEYASIDDEKASLIAYSLYASYLLSLSLLPLKMGDAIHKLKQSAHLLLVNLTK